MHKISYLFLMLCGASWLVGCSYTGQNYQSSFENVSALKCDEKKAHAINVAEFTASKEANSLVLCRLAGPIDTPTKVPYAQFLHDAFIADLKQAKLYNANAATTLHANLDAINLSTMLGNGNWQIQMTFNDGKHPAYTVSDRYEFSVNYIGDIACSEAAAALTPAMQKFLLKAYRSDGLHKTLRD